MELFMFNLNYLSLVLSVVWFSRVLAINHVDTVNIDHDWNLRKIAESLFTADCDRFVLIWRLQNAIWILPTIATDFDKMCAMEIYPIYLAR